MKKSHPFLLLAVRAFGGPGAVELSKALLDPDRRAEVSGLALGMREGELRPALDGVLAYAVVDEYISGLDDNNYAVGLARGRRAVAMAIQEEAIDVLCIGLDLGSDKKLAGEALSDMLDGLEIAAFGKGMVGEGSDRESRVGLDFARKKLSATTDVLASKWMNRGLPVSKVNAEKIKRLGGSLTPGLTAELERAELDNVAAAGGTAGKPMRRL